MDSSMLPEQLVTLLNENKLLEYRVVGHNERKGRWCVQACTNDNEKILIKWNEQVQAEAYKYLNKEIGIYTILKNTGATPRLISPAPLFSLEYIEKSCTLRSYIQKIDDEQLLAEIVGNTLNNYLKML